MVSDRCTLSRKSQKYDAILSKRELEMKKPKKVGHKDRNIPHRGETPLDSVFFCVVAERTVSHLQHFCSAYANSSGAFQSSQQIGSFRGGNKLFEVHTGFGD